LAYRWQNPLPSARRRKYRGYSADGATLTAGGFGAVDTTPWRGDDIPRNYGKLLDTPITVSSIALAANGSPAIVGEMWAGLTTWFPDFQHGTQRSPEKPFLWEGRFKSLAPYDYGVSAQRRQSGRITLETAELMNELERIFESQRLGTYPIAWLDNDLSDDPWLCQFSYQDSHSEGHYHVQLELTEIPRFKWPA
jgi:hypothetical protein